MAKRNVHLKSLIGPGVSSANQYVDVRPAFRFVDSTAVNWPDAVTYKFEAGELTINGLEDAFGSDQVVWIFQFRNLDSRNQIIGLPKTEQVDFTGTTGTTVEYTAMRQVDEFVPPEYMPAIYTQTVAARDEAVAAAAAAVAVGTTNDTIIAGRINTPGSATATALTNTYLPLQVLALDPDSIIFGSINVDSNDATTSASLTWPDGATGAFTALVLSSAFPGAVDSYKVTHVLGGVTKTYTQPTMTRNTTGKVITRPALVVS